MSLKMLRCCFSCFSMKYIKARRKIVFVKPFHGVLAYFMSQVSNRAIKSTSNSGICNMPVKFYIVNIWFLITVLENASRLQVFCTVRRMFASSRMNEQMRLWTPVDLRHVSKTLFPQHMFKTLEKNLAEWDWREGSGIFSLYASLALSFPLVMSLVDYEWQVKL